MTFLRALCTKPIFKGFLFLVLNIGISFLCSVIVFESNYSYIIPVTLFAILIFSLSYMLLKRENKQITRSWLIQRLRLKKISTKSSFKIFGFFLLLLVIEVSINKILLSYFGIDGSGILENNLAKANYKPLVIYIISFGILVGSIGEEIFWRGYLLPLQEKSIGKKAWVFNGILWAFSHALVMNPIRIISLALGFSYIATKYKSTLPTIFLHVLNNSLVVVKLFMIL